MDRQDVEKLAMLLKDKLQYSSERTDALIHAIVDISESVIKVYQELLPQFLSDPEVEKDILQDRLWDLREEFRHIDYHIHDSGFLDL